MSGATPFDLNASTIISQIEANAYPREAILTIARGFLPLSQDDLITVLAFLHGSDDDEIRETARASLLDIPSRILAAHGANEAIAPIDLVRLLDVATDAPVLEALNRNKNVPHEAIVRLAGRAEGHIQEVIVINQQRILREPQILDALLANPTLTPDARRRALEVREEFFEKRKAFEDLPGIDPELAAMPLDDIADLLEEAQAADEAGEILPPPELPEIDKADEKKMSLWAAVLKMNVAQKVVLAFKGDKTARMILIRERSRLVCSAAARNPRMTDSEAEAIAGMRNVEEEVLRIVSKKREWMSKYPIVLALVRNPKAPVGVVLPLISRLTLRDLKGLKDDKGVSEAVRVLARKTFQLRNQKS
jgi:hypothetical protein